LGPHAVPEHTPIPAAVGRRREDATIPLARYHYQRYRDGPPKPPRGKKNPADSRECDDKAYRKTKELRANGEPFYFVDGPPYTTGAIHLVRDQPGFDMHGLPIEVKVEKQIGVHSKKDIEELGIDKFVTTCKEFALGLHADMTEQFKQLGVWMDWDHPYQTIRLEYLESAWWTIQKAEEKGLLKPSSRVVTWCPRCETALAEAEIEYWDETDPSVMVRFPLKDGSASLLIWTTTPWTLAANMAVAVHPDFGYQGDRGRHHPGGAGRVCDAEGRLREVRDPREDDREAARRNGVHPAV